jgi:diadenosine tetraphosphatase ApaH/serine/threonine PP2A family protein phosphatase
MPKNQVSDLITDQEIAFAHSVLTGTMTDRQAAEAAGLNPDTAAYTKAKPRVRAYMLEHRAAMHDRLVQQQSEEQRRLNLGRERVPPLGNRRFGPRHDSKQHVRPD